MDSVRPEGSELKSGVGFRRGQVVCCEAEADMRLKSAGLSADSQGRLYLSESLHRQIIKPAPLERHFSVESQPFARGKKAVVRRCVEKSTGRRLAAKYLKKKGPEPCAEMLHEVAALVASTPCPHIVSLHSVYHDTHHLVLVLELGEGGELQTILDRDQVPSEQQVCRVMQQVLQALVYLHHINIVHLDLKPQNVVLMGEFPDCDVKLCDFGISRYLGEESDVREILGTPDYVAPEVLNYEPISLATDMWSVGVLMYVLLSGCSPFGGDTKQETFCNISQCRLDFPEDLFENVSPEARDLMSKLMTPKPCDRLSASACLAHAWFNKDFGGRQSGTRVVPAPRAPPVLDLVPVAELKSSSEESTETLVEVEIETAKPVEEQVKNKQALDRRKSRIQELALRYRQDETSSAENKVKSARVESFRCMSRASGMQTMPLTGFLKYSNNSDLLSSETLHKFKRIYISDDMASPPTSLSAVSVSSNSSSGFASADSSCESNSDSVSEMSLDSSSDRSSIISLDDPGDYGYKGALSLRHYSSCGNVWEATEREVRFPRECRGSVAKALSKFHSPDKQKPPSEITRHPKLTLFSHNKLTIPPQINKKPPTLELMKETKGNFVIIRETRPVNGSRCLRTTELKCESVQSRIKKFDPLKLDVSKNNKYEVF